jgi:hypothetical protein
MATNEIRITNENDSLILKDNEIHAFADNSEHVYNLSVLSRSEIISSNSKQGNIEKSLVLYIGDDTAIFINSGHKCFEPFLFKQLNSSLSLNHKKIIDAMGCTEDNTFEIYNCTQNVYCIAALSLFIVSIACIFGSILNYDSDFSVLFAACGLNIVGFVCNVIALIKNPNSRFASIMLGIYIMNYIYIIPMVYFFVACASCDFSLDSLFNQNCEQCS